MTIFVPKPSIESNYVVLGMEKSPEKHPHLGPSKYISERYITLLLKKKIKIMSLLILSLIKYSTFTFYLMYDI